MLALFKADTLILTIFVSTFGQSLFAFYLSDPEDDLAIFKVRPKQSLDVQIRILFYFCQIFTLKICLKILKLFYKHVCLFVL